MSEESSVSADYSSCLSRGMSDKPRLGEDRPFATFRLEQLEKNDSIWLISCGKVRRWVLRSCVDGVSCVELNTVQESSSKLFSKIDSSRNN